MPKGGKCKVANQLESTPRVVDQFQHLHVLVDHRHVQTSFSGKGMPFVDGHKWAAAHSPLPFVSGAFGSARLARSSR